MQTPTHLPGTFPPSPPLAPSPHRGRVSSSVQSRRSAAALGLGVSFAVAPTPSPPVSRSHSRRSSISLSRRPSLSHLASFLSGIEHVTRVRTAGGRGVSRSHSRAGGVRSPRTPFEEEPFLDTAPSSPKGPASTYREGGEASAALDIFEEGERVGVGVWLEGRGGWARDCFDDGVAGPGELEVVRRLGEGTYAIVYLVKEVLFDPLATGDDSGDPFFPAPPVTYGRSFALKCLCKKDLSDELVEVQRGEAILTRALPEHDNIVRLYGAYETDDWLFLVLEYCPGQDLYYWLDERADDSEALYDLHSRAASPFQSPSPLHRPSSTASDDDDVALTYTPAAAAALLDATPPSPSLLSSTANASLLSRRRLRLISRMFGQMCAAVQACHEVGISHRDIKPENFIVSDGRGEGTARVVVKLTDWGLGTREVECEDFDCGSKPYMAYECRNNLNPTYDPRQADVWSLGLVLLNLLYHRNPWADPSLSDPDFAAYVRDPRGFLQDRFEGIGEEVAAFLSDRVFCDVLEYEADGKLRRRVSAGDFGKWAGRLVIMMGEGKRKRASVSDHTFTLAASVSRPGPLRSNHLAGTPSLLSQFAPPTTFGSLDDLHADVREELPSVTEEPEQLQQQQQHTPRPIPPFRPVRAGTHRFEEDDEPLPSPSFPPLSLPDGPEQPSFFLSPRRSLPPLSVAEEVAPPVVTPQTLSPLSSPPLSPSRPTMDNRLSSSGLSVETEDDDVRCWGGEPDSQKEKSKRRKRGARKGRTTTTTSGTNTSNSSPPISPLETVAETRDQTLADLAAASQDLARELSKAAVRPSIGTQSLTSPASTKSKSSSSSKPSPSPAAPKSSGGVFGRMRGLVMDGNQDLNALRQRAMERNADTYSAPAKMQGRGSGAPVGAGSSASRGASSHGSWSADDGSRGRSSTHGNDDHWSSASSRRERQQQQRKRVASPASSTRAGTSSTSATVDGSTRSHTPISSFSSVASGDWRNTSPHPHAMRPYSTSRTRPSTTLKDAATDTADLPIVPPLRTPAPAPGPAPTPAPAPVSVAFVPPVRPPSTSSQTTVEAAPVIHLKPNKLAKMLNSISVFNRTQERPVG